MLSRPSSCSGCPANATARGFVPPSGNTNARMAIVGHGPTSDEAIYGEPFVGPMGSTLDRWLVRAGIPRETLALGHITWCQTPKEPSPKAVQHCWKAHVRPWLTSLTNVRVVVPCGVPAIQAIVGRDASAAVSGTRIAQRHLWPGEPYGTPEVPEGDAPVGVQPVQPGDGPTGSWLSEVPSQGPTVDVGVDGGSGPGWVQRRSLDRPSTVVLAPILHPQSILRGQWALEPAQVQFLKRAWDIAKSDVPPELPDVRQAPPNCNPVPSINDLAQFVWDTQSNDVLACDIEGTQGRLIGIGFCRLRDEVGIYVPFLNGEVTYWSETQWPIAENMVRALLTRPLVFHNGQAFDIPFLESCGYEVPRYHDDTMIRHHILYAEMPKSLEELAVLYCGFPSWKWLSKVGELEDGK